MVTHQLAESLNRTRSSVRPDRVLPELANGLCNLRGGKQRAVVDVQFEIEHSRSESPTRPKCLNAAHRWIEVVTTHPVRVFLAL